MKKPFAVFISLTLCCFLLTGFSGIGFAEADDAAVIKAYGYMASYGIDITRFEISVPNGADYVSLLPEDFVVEGVVANALNTTPTAGSVTRASASEHIYYLDVEPFLWNESRETLQVTCTNAALSFTGADVTQVICPELDAFTSETFTVGETTVQYKLYTPENAETSQYPVLIYNHGGGATGPDGVLTDDSFGCAFATKDSQALFPCYVIVPYRASVSNPNVNGEEEMQAIKATIDQLIEAGLADPERIYMSGASAGSLYTMSFVNTYPDYLAAIVLMNGGPMEIADGTDLETAKAMKLASPWSDDELKALAESKTAVMFVQALGDTLSVPIRFAAAYAKLVDYGMIPGDNLIWNSYDHNEFNMLLKGGTKITYRGIENVTVDPITGKESYQNGLCHESPKPAGWDLNLRRWLSTRTLNNLSISGANAASPFAGISFPDFVTKAQLMLYTSEETGETLNVYVGANDDVSEVYFGFDTGYFCEIMGSVENGQVTVTYESFTGFLAQLAQPMYEQIDPDAWQALGSKTPSFAGITFPDFVTKAQIIAYTVEEGGQTATFDVYVGANDNVSEVYFGFDTGYFCEIMGSVEDGQVTVTYESFAGFLGHYAQPMYNMIDPDAWTLL